MEAANQRDFRLAMQYVKAAGELELVDADYETMATLGRLAIEYRARATALMQGLKLPTQ